MVGPSRDSDGLKLAEQEQLLADRESKLTAKEQELASRESGLQKRQRVQSEAEQFLRQRLDTLRLRALRQKAPAEFQARLRGLAETPRQFPSPQSPLPTDELAGLPRQEALRQRALALRLRGAAAGAWQRGVEEREASFQRRVDRLKALEEELGRISLLLDRLDQQATLQRQPPVEATPLATSREQATDLRVDAMAAGRGAIATAVRPLLRAEDEADGAERRIEPRLGVKVSIGFGTEHNLFVGRTHNISGGGLFIATRKMMPVGQKVELLFSLPSSPAVHCQGEVAWLHLPGQPPLGLPPGMGVRFHALPPEAATAIRQFLDQRQPIVMNDPTES
ncbi:MAG: TIGR02266 family protein [Myxococcota bacterium]|jgi:uncharacterized protein (TIGR02266 family)|nr:TIGR02266 family protein [Myxococcota bacterium]